MTALRQAQFGRLAAARPGLVVVDVQADFCAPEAARAYGAGEEALTALQAAVSRIADLVGAARALGVPVAWVGLESDPARPWKAAGWLRGAGSGAPAAPPGEPCLAGTPGAAWYRVAPEPGELQVTKRRYSGFFGTRLDGKLRAAGCQWLVITGVTSECCVAATAVDAVQRDWPVLVPRDATAAYDPGVNAAALAQLAMNAAVLCEAAEVISLWERQAGP